MSIRAYVPNLITLIRFFLCPWIFYGLMNSRLGLALLLVAVCALSDALDGYLARKWSAVSELGRFLDPFADRFFCACGFVALMLVGHCPSWFVALLISVAVLQNAGYVILRVVRTRYVFVPQVLRISKWNMGLQCLWIAVEFGLLASGRSAALSRGLEQAAYLFLAGVQSLVFVRYFQKYRNLLIPHFRALGSLLK